MQAFLHCCCDTLKLLRYVAARLNTNTYLVSCDDMCLTSTSHQPHTKATCTWLIFSSISMIDIYTVDTKLNAIAVYVTLMLCGVDVR